MSEFDLKVHIIDPKTKRVVRKNPYRAIFVDKQVFYERPVGSGIFYYANGKEVPPDKTPPMILAPRPTEVEALNIKRKKLIADQELVDEMQAKLTEAKKTFTREQKNFVKEIAEQKIEVKVEKKAPEQSGSVSSASVATLRPQAQVQASPSAI